MPKCVYCGKMYEFPRGLTLVEKEGRVKYLCSQKCRKNMAMKRRKVEWIRKAKKSKEDGKQGSLHSPSFAKANEEVSHSFVKAE